MENEQLLEELRLKAQKLHDLRHRYMLEGKQTLADFIHGRYFGILEAITILKKLNENVRESEVKVSHECKFNSELTCIRSYTCFGCYYFKSETL